MLRPVLGPLLAAAAAVALAAGTVALVAPGGRDPTPLLRTPLPGRPPDYDYVIPAGTADRLARGETVDIIPSPLEVTVGQVIRIRNDDGAPALVGPFYVGAGETLVQEFRSAGRLEGICRLHPSGRLVVDVRPAR